MIKTIEITTAVPCPVQCPYCPQDQLRTIYTGNPVMSFELFRSCIGKIDVGVDIHFTGMCEPFENFACMDMIEYAFEKGHKVAISTTLPDNTYPIIGRLCELPWKMFDVHLPSGAEKMDYEYQGQSLEYVRKNKPSGLKIHYFADYGKMVHRAGHRKAKVRASRQKKQLHFGGVTCRRDFSQPVLLPDGSLVLCCEDYGLNAILGNLYISGMNVIEKARLKYKQGAESGKISICHYCAHYGEEL